MKRDYLLTKLYNMYSFLEISYDEFLNIVKSLNIVSEDNYTGKKGYDKYLTEVISNKFNEIIETVFKDNKKAFYIVNKYINNNLKYTSNYNDVLDNINKLMSFLNFINFIPEVDFIIKLFNDNEVICKLFDVVINKHMSFIKSGKINNIFSDRLLILFIEVYADKKGIEMNIYSEEDICNFDSVKMYLDSIGGKKILTKEESDELLYRMRQGDKEARKKFIEHNLKLVVSFAKKYFTDNDSVLDIIQYGNIGLMIAVDKFDEEKGCRFSTYAKYWIEQSIMQNMGYLDSNIRITVTGKSKIKKYNDAKRKLEIILCREPNIEEIALEMNISVAEVYKIASFQKPMISLNDRKSEDSDEVVLNYIPSDDISLEEQGEKILLALTMQKLFKLAKLTDDEITVLEHIFGIGGKSEKKLDEIAVIVGVTRERIRQIEAKALYKLRMFVSKHPSEYTDYLDNPDAGREKIYEYVRAYRMNSQNRYKSNPLK